MDAAPDSSIDGLAPLERQVVDFFVDGVRVLGLPRSIGEIYGLLFISRSPLALDDLVQRLGISKGSASQGLRMLKSLGAVREASGNGNGERRTYYEPAVELKRLVGGFIREQIRGSIVRGKAYGNQIHSKRVRLPDEMAILESRGDQTVIFELQGSLFFGTTDQLYTSLEPELKTRTYIILDMRRVQSVDFTAVHMLEQIEAILRERGATLIFSHLPEQLPSGQDMRQYFDQVGLIKSERHVRMFSELDEALEWIEERLIEEQHLERMLEKPLELREIDVFLGRKESTLDALEACMEKRTYKAGEKIFSQGDTGDELFLIRRGAVRIVLPLGNKQSHHLATFGRGDFFGEMAFLDPDPRSADALAFSDVDLFVLSRKRFDTLAEEHKRLAIGLVLSVARVLSTRLRYANAELRALHMS